MEHSADESEPSEGRNRSWVWDHPGINAETLSQKVKLHK